MTIIKLTAFAGESPRTTPRLLPDTGAQIAQDVRLEDGELSPFRKPTPVEALVGAVAGQVKTIYKHMGAWLHWSSIVDAVPGPVAQDRLYYTGDGVPKMRVGSTVYPLALSAPSVKLTATRVGSTTAITSTVLYVYTRVTSFGEESEPSPISADLLVSPGNSVTLSGFVAAPAGRGFTMQRIYRSQTGTTGGANLYLIAERADTASDFTDALAATGFAEPLPSLDWNPPPDGLSGLVAMPNGIMAGYVGKDVYFSEPYRPHAWPEKYVLSTNYDITGLAVSGSMLIVGTKGWPEVVAGASPETMTMERVELSMPCLSGMVDLGYAVLYPSNDGLVMVQGGSPTLISERILTRDQWQKFDPGTLVCGQFYGRFYASYSYVEGEETKQGTLIFDLTGTQPYLIRSRHKADAMFYDITNNCLYMAMGTTVYEWDAKAGENDTFTYKSKAFVTPQPTSFGAILVEGGNRDSLDAIAAYEAAREEVFYHNESVMAAGSMDATVNDLAVNEMGINADTLRTMPTGPQIAVNVYADGDFIATVTSLGQMERLPPKLARQWEIEVIGNIDIQEVTMAGTAQELRSA